MTITFTTLEDEGDLTLPAICTVLVIIIYALLNGAVHNHAQVIQRIGREENDSLTNEEFDTIGYRGSLSQRFRSSRSSSNSLHEDPIRTAEEGIHHPSNSVEDEDPSISRAGLFDYSPDDTMEETLSDASSDDDYSPHYSLSITPEEARLQKKLLNKDIYDIFNIDYISDDDNDDHDNHDDYFDFKKRSLFPKGEEDQGEDRSPLYNEDYGYEDENAETEEDSSSIQEQSSTSVTSSGRSSLSESDTIEGDDSNVTRRPSFHLQRSSQPSQPPHEPLAVEVLTH